MVLEHLFPENYLERRAGFALLLGAIYSIIGISLAKLLFGANSGLASVMFVSILLLPSLKKLFAREEREEERERRFSLRHLYRDNRQLVHAYAGVFIGVFVTYFLVSSLGLRFGWDVQSLFREQVFLDPVIAGRATYSFGTFWSILSNNWWVLLACFLLSLISGNGATFFVVWNASAWGVIFGLRTVAAASVLGMPAIGVAVVMLLTVLPHVLLEGGAYILAGIAGAVISDDVIKKASSLKRFIGIFFLLVVIFWIANFLLNQFGHHSALFVVKVGLALWLLYLSKHAFDDARHREVFTYNYWLFVVALAVFILGALVETGVLSWSAQLTTFYAAASRFFLI